MVRGLLAALLLAIVTFGEAAAGSGVVINGSELAPATVQRLERMGGRPIPPGRYWYDPRAGLWGYEGGPMAGETLAGVELGAPLRPDASGGRTPVFINGRALHPVEVQFLGRLYGRVQPGRYWLNANGVGGFEGGPPLFNLRQRVREVFGSGGSSYSPGIGGRPGVHVGQASDGCVYYSYGGYSGQSC